MSYSTKAISISIKSKRCFDLIRMILAEIKKFPFRIFAVLGAVIIIFVVLILKVMFYSVKFFDYIRSQSASMIYLLKPSQYFHGAKTKKI